jgi:hypothetical protein
MVANITGLENCHVTLLYDVLNLKWNKQNPETKLATV